MTDISSRTSMVDLYVRLAEIEKTALSLLAEKESIIAELKQRNIIDTARITSSSGSLQA